MAIIKQTTRKPPRKIRHLSVKPDTIDSRMNGLLDNNSTINCLDKNDPTFTKLSIGYRPDADTDGYKFYGYDEISNLGKCIGDNTHLTTLSITFHTEDVRLNQISDMVDGLIKNVSIKELSLLCRHRTNRHHQFRDRMAHDRIICQILEVYERKNTLSSLCIQEAALEIWPHGQVIFTTLRRCTHLKQVHLVECGITDEDLLSIVDAIKGHPALEKLHLGTNYIGNVGCEALATLLEDSNCNIHTLNLVNNQIGTIGATYLASGLVSNTKLKHLDLADNARHIDPSTMDTVFGGLLCNMESPTATYYSNHTLERLYFDDMSMFISFLVSMNDCSIKSYVAIRKILEYHPNIDMEPLFGWDSESEWSLKSLPYVVAWFERAREAVIVYGHILGYYNFEEEESERCSVLSGGDEGGAHSVEDRIQYVEEEYDDVVEESSMSSSDSSMSSDEDDIDEDDIDEDDIDNRKLSAIYAFAKAMPMLFVPPSHAKSSHPQMEDEGSHKRMKYTLPTQGEGEKQQYGTEKNVSKQYDSAKYQPQMPPLPSSVSNDQSWEGVGEEKKEEEHDTPSAAVAEHLDNTCVIS